jgi:hypothetical protein
MSYYQIWGRGQEQVTLSTNSTVAGFLIDVKTTEDIWTRIQQELENNSHARTENTHTTNQTTAPTIRPRNTTDRQQDVLRATEEALTKLGFTKA